MAYRCFERGQRSKQGKCTQVHTALMLHYDSSITFCDFSLCLEVVACSPENLINEDIHEDLSICDSIKADSNSVLQPSLRPIFHFSYTIPFSLIWVAAILSKNPIHPMQQTSKNRGSKTTYLSAWIMDPITIYQQRKCQCQPYT